MILENVTLRWVNHIKPDSYGNLTMDVMLDGEQQLAMSEAGLTLRNDEDGVFYRFSYPPVTKDGDPVTINITDRFGIDFLGKVRNGAKADVDYYAYSWTFGAKAGVKGRVVTAKLLDDAATAGSMTYDLPEE